MNRLTPKNINVCTLAFDHVRRLLAWSENFAADQEAIETILISLTATRALRQRGIECRHPRIVTTIRETVAAVVGSFKPSTCLTAVGKMG